ncbi:MAG: hypothetical protein ACRD3Q_07750 [Terriglobales bacterium]
MAIWIVLTYLLINIPGLIEGAINGTDTSIMFTELQQSLYWLAAPFFACTLASMAYVERTARLAKWSGLFLSCAYIGIVIALATGVLNVRNLFAVLHQNGEVVSRGNGLLFYKGDLYLGISIIFLTAMRDKYWFPATLLVGIALVLTLTRGFILATSAAVLLLLAVQRRKYALVTGLILVAVAIGFVWYYFPSLNEVLSGNWAISNRQRVDDMEYMLSHASVKTLLVGEGFGAPINDRIDIENTFLWALWKLGFLGLTFWLMPLVLCTSYFLQIKDRGQNRLACAFFFGTVLIYIQTLSNPYLNNPIGLSFVLLSIFALRTIAKGEDFGTAFANRTGSGMTSLAS